MWRSPGLRDDLFKDDMLKTQEIFSQASSTHTSPLKTRPPSFFKFAFQDLQRRLTKIEDDDSSAFTQRRERLASLEPQGGLLKHSMAFCLWTQFQSPCHRFWAC
jgi:hypothetical protein